jgi:hypothetical protein
MTHGTEPRGIDAVPGSTFLEGRFGRLFRKLPAFEPKDDLLIDLGKNGGPMEEKAEAVKDSLIPAGITYLGQFVDHDMTFDPTSSFDKDNDPNAIHNFRTPRFDLDSVYGSGPRESRFLFDRDDDRFLLEGRNGNREFDLPRNKQERALLGDVRNDENILISQMHVAFIRFHNALIRFLDKPANRDRFAFNGEPVFRAAQRLARWHFQWIVANEFARTICGPAVVDDILVEKSGGRLEVETRFYHSKKRAFMPVEFSVAAYRFGHSMIRPRYDLNDLIRDTNIFGKKKDPPLSHLGGNRELPADWQIKWPLFFKFPQKKDPQVTRKIDAKLASPLMQLPDTVVVEMQHPERTSLAVRNLLRGKALGLPSGQAVATAMGETPLTNQELGLTGGGWGGGAPLWFYVLREAGLKQDGERLGPVGGRIVAEVLLGLIGLDNRSFVNGQRKWEPEPPIAPKKGQFKMDDLLTFADVA